MSTTQTLNANPHDDRLDLRQLKVVAGMSPLNMQVTLDGKPWAGLCSLRFIAETGQLCRVEATFYANVEVEAELREVTLTNAPWEPQS